jgi:6-phosphogluconolactonase
MNIHTAATKSDLIIDFANWLINDIEKVLATKNRYSIALSGGSTPTELFKLFATDTYKSAINWQKIHIFWGDERDVPFEDDRNNAKHAFDLLLNKVPIPANQIHIINTNFSADIAGRKYEQLLREYFDRMPTSFDLAILGMGDDGHTLSLFPGSDAVNETTKWVLSYYLAPQQMNRITITAPITNKAAAVCFLVSGTSKAPALKEVLQGDYQPNMYPAQRIKPINGNLHWFIDKEAATLL